MPRPVPNLIGNRYGKLVVTKRAPDFVSPKGYKRHMWECQCDCGNRIIVRGDKLIKKEPIQSCGCDMDRNREKNGQFKKGVVLNDLTGKRFGKLTVIGLDRIVNRRSYWIVECECGNRKSVRGDTLKVITSCGCDKKRQDIINLGIANNHNMTYHPVYSIWHAMMQRCEQPNCHAYQDYGGRGIKVCEEWRDVREFAKWADENGFVPNKNLSIERKDVNGNYEPDNCCWIDRKLQARNRRITIKLNINGTERPLSEWSELYGVKHSLALSRYEKGYREPKDLFYPGNLQMRDLGKENIPLKYNP